MTPEERAKKLIPDTVNRQPYEDDVRDLTAAIAQALRAERERALEEAAEVLDPINDKHARLVRSLKDAQVRDYRQCDQCGANKQTGQSHYCEDAQGGSGG